MDPFKVVMVCIIQLRGEVWSINSNVYTEDNQLVGNDTGAQWKQKLMCSLPSERIQLWSTHNVKGFEELV